METTCLRFVLLFTEKIRQTTKWILYNFTTLRVVQLEVIIHPNHVIGSLGIGLKQNTLSIRDIKIMGYNSILICKCNLRIPHTPIGGWTCGFEEGCPQIQHWLQYTVMQYTTNSQHILYRHSGPCRIQGWSLVPPQKRSKTFSSCPSDTLRDIFVGRASLSVSG